MAVHREQGGHRVCRAMARQERRSQHAADLIGEFFGASGLHGVHLLLQPAVQVRVVAGQGSAQPVGGEYQRVPICIEFQRRLKEAAVRPDILRLAAGQQDLAGLPGGVAQAAHDVEHRGHRGVAELVGGLEVRLMDVVAQLGPRPIDAEARHHASNMQMQIDAEHRAGGAFGAARVAARIALARLLMPRPGNPGSVRHPLSVQGASV